ncbi:succinate dehydrogenase [ubiquinone] cytochrome b small subunit, mitochondrial [Anabrus simplex]|uniref:succinate dehydrogenase [ubiquinone] cytochrome b small subunit, mitochondrial n=1 Tax=Anabrus simplex TaxID=316456 RepID=UPI0035A2746D
MMALNCFLRSIPSSLRDGTRRFISTGHLLRTSPALGSPVFNYKPLNDHQKFVWKQNVVALPLLQKMDFSVSSKLQSKAHENHSKLWSAERIVALALLGIVPAALVAPSQPLECIMAVSLVMHTHWGIEAIVVDYVRPILFGPVIPKIAHGLVYALSIVTLVGLFYLIFDGCGIVNTLRLLWRL